MQMLSAVVAFPFFAAGFVGGFLARATYGGIVTGWNIVVQTEAQKVIEELDKRREKRVREALTEADLVL